MSCRWSPRESRRNNDAHLKRGPDRVTDSYYSLWETERKRCAARRMSNLKCKLWFLHRIPHSTSGFPVEGLRLGLRDLLFSLAWGLSLYLPDPQSLSTVKEETGQHSYPSPSQYSRNLWLLLSVSIAFFSIAILRSDSIVENSIKWEVEYRKGKGLTLNEVWPWEIGSRQSSREVGLSPCQLELVTWLHLSPVTPWD